MHRRDFLKGTSAAALGLTATTLASARHAMAADDADALAAPSVVPQRRSLRMVSLWPDAVSGPGDHVRRFAKRIEAAMDGRWVIEITDAPVVGADAFKAVMTGQADLYAGHEHGNRALHPAFSYFAGLPCRTGMDIDQLNAWLMAAGGQELWDDLAAEFNMKGLAIGHSGPARGLFTRTPIVNREDFKGRRIAANGLAADIMTAIGAAPAEDLANPIDAAIADTSALDGIEAGGFEFALARRHTEAFHRAMPHRLLPGLNDAGVSMSLGLRRSLWDGLSNAERIMLGAIAGEALQSSRADRIAEDRMDAFMTSATASTADPVQPLHWRMISAELTRIAETIVADLAGHDDHARRINASYMAFKGVRRLGASA